MTVFLAWKAFLLAYLHKASRHDWQPPQAGWYPPVSHGWCRPVPQPQLPGWSCHHSYEELAVLRGVANTCALPLQRGARGTCNGKAVNAKTTTTTISNPKQKTDMPHAFFRYGLYKK